MATVFGVALTLYFGFLLAADYRSATALRKTMNEQRFSEIGRRVSVLV